MPGLPPPDSSIITTVQMRRSGSGLLHSVPDTCDSRRGATASGNSVSIHRCAAEIKVWPLILPALKRYLRHH